MIKSFFSTPLLLSSLLCWSMAEAAVLDFEGFSNGQIIDFEYQPLATISAINHANEAGFADLAVVLDSRLSSNGDVDLRAPFRSHNADFPDPFRPGNILILQENNLGCDDGICDRPDDEGSRFSDRPTGKLRFQFERAIELISLDFFDIETIEAANASHNRIRLFDQNNLELYADSYHVPNTGGDNLWDQVLFGTQDQGLTGISRIEVYFAGSGALDNLVFKDLKTVPIPTAMWLFGSALVGFIAYSRRRYR